MWLNRILGAVGRTLITLGMLMLMFAGFQLWGTGVEESQHQADLATNAAKALDVKSASDESDEAIVGRITAELSRVDPQTAPALAPPAEGDWVGLIEIPKIGLSPRSIVAGVSKPDLRKGPGHYPGTPLPGQPGNAAIAGHRTTYGAPFNRVDELKSGDEITITYVTGAEFTYSYRTTEIVTPDRTDVLQAKDFDGDGETDNMLTLTACHPKYSARERIIIRARLEEAPIPIPQGQRPTRQEEVSLDDAEQTEPVSKAPAVLWGLAAAAIWLAAYFVGRAWRKWPAYLIGFPFFAVTLYVFFENFYKLLPAGF